MGTIKSFFLKHMLKSKLKGLPPAEQEKVLKLVEEHPDFFKKIGDEIKKRQKTGQSEIEATMSVMREHQSELQQLLMK